MSLYLIYKSIIDNKRCLSDADKLKKKLDTIKQINDIVVYLELKELEPNWSNTTLLAALIIANILQSWPQEYDTMWIN